jgi:adenylate cyclase
VHWEDHRAHFWLVFSVALVCALLGLVMSEAARRRGDARVFLVGLAFLASSGFLGLHALATPGVLLDGKNTGFVIATPIGLFLAAILAATSGLDFRGHNDAQRVLGRDCAGRRSRVRRLDRALLR